MPANDVLRLRRDEPLAISLHAAIRTGDVTCSKQAIDAHPTLVSAVADAAGNEVETSAIIEVLLDSGSDLVNREIHPIRHRVLQGERWRQLHPRVKISDSADEFTEPRSRERQASQ